MMFFLGERGSRVWTKREEGHGLPCGQPCGLPVVNFCVVRTKRGVGHGLSYGLPVVIFFKTGLSIAVNLFKQCTPTICHIYDTLLSSWRRFAQIF